jgi:hypothetical protein
MTPHSVEGNQAMADTRAATGLTVQQWDDEFFVEYIDDVDFADIMGESPNAIIQVKENLTKKKGDSVTFALLNRLKNNATTSATMCWRATKRT